MKSLTKIVRGYVDEIMMREDPELQNIERKDIIEAVKELIDTSDRNRLHYVEVKKLLEKLKEEAVGDPLEGKVDPEDMKIQTWPKEIQTECQF